MSPLLPSRPKLDRKAVMVARPRQMEFVHRAELEEGGLKVTVKLRATRMARFLGGGGEFERSFSLDVLGREVYEMCEGKMTVQEIVRVFARRHKLSVSEAEISVTTYLKTLVSKALVAMIVEKPED